MTMDKSSYHVRTEDGAITTVAGCDGCREVGPLLTAAGTSGRDWMCQTCGTVWPGLGADR